MQACFVFDQVGITLHRRMRRQHVVVSGDDANVERTFGDHLESVVYRHARHSVGQIGTAHAIHTPAAGGRGVELLKIGTARGAAALNDARRDGRNRGMKRHDKHLSSHAVGKQPLP